MTYEVCDMKYGEEWLGVEAWSHEDAAEVETTITAVRE